MGKKRSLRDIARERREDELGKITVVKDGEVRHGSYELSTAQETMKVEMLAPASGRLPMGKPGPVRRVGTLGEVLDEVLKLSQPASAVEAEFRQVAYEVINDHTPAIPLKLGEWAAVQQMLEEAVKRGYERGFQAGLNDA